jgi:hypothetical protein
VASSNLRLAAGIGVVATCLLVGGPSVAVAIAEPSGGSHSGSGGGSDTRGGSRSGSDWSDNNVNSGSRSGTSSTSDGRPSSRVGSGRDSGTSDQRPSSDFSPDRPGQDNGPKVTFGDGRTPGVQDNDPERGWGGGAPEPAPPPPPEVITVPLNPPTISPVREPGVVQQLVVAPTSGLGDPLWGAAGLLLIPAAGAVLGYRQARAAQSAAELGRHP